jgi:DNA excision repair protein ERCC-4
MPQPDLDKAVGMGSETDPELGKGVNAVAEELVRSLPGVTAGNVKYLMSRAGSVKGLCAMNRAELVELLGVDPGRTCYDFIHRGKPKN